MVHYLLHAMDFQLIRINDVSAF